MLRIGEEYKAKNRMETRTEDSKAKVGENLPAELIVTDFRWNLAKVLANPHSVQYSSRRLLAS